MIKEGTRFSGADWASELRDIMLIGVGGIGSWLCLNLARIGHSLYLVDPDQVDPTNVTGGQLYRHSDVGKNKVNAVGEICRQLGCTNQMISFPTPYKEEMGMTDIVLTGLDNMTARKQVFTEWWDHSQSVDHPENCLLLDGRLTLEMYEVFALSGTDEQGIEQYRQEHLFSDEQAQLLDCTTKQSTFGAMGIASLMTATLCNFLTNQKLGEAFRELPFYQRMYFPCMQYISRAPAPLIGRVREEKQLQIV